MRNETETKRNETDRNETKQIETKQNSSKETKQIETKRNKSKRNETNDMASHCTQKWVFSSIRNFLILEIHFVNIGNSFSNIRK